MVTPYKVCTPEHTNKHALNHTKKDSCLLIPGQTPEQGTDRGSHLHVSMLVLTIATQPINEIGAAIMQCNYHYHRDTSFG